MGSFVVVWISVGWKNHGMTSRVWAEVWPPPPTRNRKICQCALGCRGGVFEDPEKQWDSFESIFPAVLLSPSSFSFLSSSHLVTSGGPQQGQISSFMGVFKRLEVWWWGTSARESALNSMALISIECLGQKQGCWTMFFLWKWPGARCRTWETG